MRVDSYGEYTYHRKPGGSSLDFGLSSDWHSSHGLSRLKPEFPGYNPMSRRHRKECQMENPYTRIYSRDGVCAPTDSSHVVFQLRVTSYANNARNGSILDARVICDLWSAQGLPFEHYRSPLTKRLRFFLIATDVDPECMQANHTARYLPSNIECHEA